PATTVVSDHANSKIQQLHARIQPTLACTNARSSIAGVISCPRSHALAEPISSDLSSIRPAAITRMNQYSPPAAAHSPSNFQPHDPATS
ncbi:hypothetical protein ACLOJK_034494, partial [Asimina triloba]